MKRQAIIILLGCALCTLQAHNASADVKQPDGTVVPNPAVGCFSGKPGGLAAVFACACTQSGVCNIGKSCPGGSTSCDPGTNGTCESTLWHTANDDPCIPSNRSGLDPVKDAAVKPQTFRPVCGLRFELLAREAIFKNAFGWYNVTGKKPDAKDLHVLVNCTSPLKKQTPFDLISDPAYSGGDIGFFLVTPESQTSAGQCANGDCCATVARAGAGQGRIYYSEAQFNPDNKGPGSFIHLLIYPSQIGKDKFYFAWEDTFGGSTNEFTDFVTGVEGISCAGAGLRCSTKKVGICDIGVTKCVGGSQPECIGVYQAEGEICDGQDNNCDGKIDNGAQCDGAKVCYNGVCVPHCKITKEFACQIGFTCDETSGICVDKRCESVVCKGDEICKAGVCKNGCDGVVCPLGQLCRAGACVDPCAGRSCAKGQICKLGVCIPNCNTCGGLTCAGALTCDKTSGDCIDPSCASPCPSGKRCSKGACVGPCHQVICPGGTTCVGGVCPPPGIGKPQPTGDLGGTISTDAGVNDGGVIAGDAKADDFDSGCSCRMDGVDSAAPLSLLWLALLLCRRRRRRAR